MICPVLLHGHLIDSGLDRAFCHQPNADAAELVRAYVAAAACPAHVHHFYPGASLPALLDPFCDLPWWKLALGPEGLWFYSMQLLTSNFRAPTSSHTKRKHLHLHPYTHSVGELIAHRWLHGRCLPSVLFIS